MFISAIIPAYNEEKTIVQVISVLKRMGKIGEIIVVSDGSTDRTACISQMAGAKVIQQPKNMGKGAAVKAGLEWSRGDVILLLDADLIGLREEHVNRLLEPIVQNRADMTLGVFSSGRIPTHLAHKISPCLSGQRAVRKSILEGISNLELLGYGMEIALTKYAETENIRLCEVELGDLTHVMKEEKLGLVRGFIERIKMYRQILREMKLARR
ncbi:MAG: glycosyltransferase family 2 protein [Clostridiales bacterium]|nr:glycosyltransferase family 2 protein [Eubacteriales bacterium]MDH7564901.1 glycosyltransferase family 2 protein [Clostridiales bacterium]